MLHPRPARVFNFVVSFVMVTALAVPPLPVHAHLATSPGVQTVDPGSPSSKAPGIDADPDPSGDVLFTQQGELVDDRDGNGVVSPGDRLRYTLTIHNDTSQDKSDLDIQSPVNSALDLLPESINSTPLAYNQSVSVDEDVADVFTLSASDPDGDPLTYVITNTAALNGTLDTGALPQVTYTPAENYHGPASFSFQVCDNGADGTCPATASPMTALVGLTVNPLNDPPSFSNAGDVELVEGAGAQVFPDWATGMTPGPADEAGQTLTFSVTTDADSLFSSLPTVAADGTLAFTPHPDASGQAEVRVTLSDNGVPPASASVTFTITFQGVNDPPTLNAPGTLNIAEDAGLQTVALSGIGDGSAFENDPLSITATSSNPDLIPDPSLVYTSPAATAELRMTPAAGESGFADISVTVSDGQAENSTLTRTFRVNVAAVNDPPRLSAPSTWVLDEDDGLQTIQVSGIDSGASNEDQTLTFSVSSSDTGLIPTPDYTYTYPAASLELTFTPVPGKSGTATLTLTLDDGQPLNYETVHTIAVTVNGINNPPTLNALGDVSLDEDAGLQTVALAGIGSGSLLEDDSLSISAVSDNPGLIPNPTVSYTSPATTGQLSFTPAADAFGEATLSVTVSDGQPENSTLTRTFTVSVEPVNDPPHLATIGDLTIDEDAALQTVSLGSIHTGAANEDNPLSISAVSDNPGLIPNPTVSYTSPAATGQLSFTPLADKNGAATITVTLSDGQTTNPTSVRQFTVTVLPINDPPQMDDNTLAIDENTANTAVVTTPAFSDPDASQTHTFSITAGNATGAFSIGESTGQIRVADSTRLDYETTPSFSLTVRVEDNAVPPASDSAEITINLNDIDEAPSVAGESYQTIGNTQLQVAATQTALEPAIFVAGNLLTNDSDPEGASLRAALLDATPGAMVSVALDGTFTYVPPPGTTVSDTFRYTVKDATDHSSIATVTIQVVNQVWYVKNDGPAVGVGTSIAPFDTLGEAQAASRAGDTIYVYSGTGTATGQDGGIVMQNNQRLIGAGVELSVPGAVNGGPDPTVLLPAGGSAPLITHLAAGGNAITLGPGGGEVRGVYLRAAANGIDATYTGAGAGTVSIAQVTILSSGEEGIDLNQAGAGSLVASLSDLTVSATGDGLDVERSNGTLWLSLQRIQILTGVNGIQIGQAAAPSALFVTAFSDLTVSGSVTGVGVDVSNTIFDATPGGSFDLVSAGALRAGVSGDPTGTAGLQLTNSRGELSFTDLDVFAGNGPALLASSSEVYSGSGGLRLSVSIPSAAVLESSGAPALNLSRVTVDLPLHHFRASGGMNGMRLDVVAGTLSDTPGGGSAISGTTSGAVSITNSSLNLVCNASISNAVGYTVYVDSGTGGILRFAGPVTGSGLGVSLTGNTGSTIDFSGGLILTTTGGNAGLVATGGGSLSVTGDNNSISTQTGVVLNVTNVTITAQGLNFKSLSGNGFSGSAVILNNTGSSGGLNVTGTGATANSGGQLLNQTSGSVSCNTHDTFGCYAVVSLTNASNVSLRNMNIANAANTGLSAHNVNGLTLTYSNLTTIGNQNDEHAILVTQPRGNVLINNVALVGFAETGIRIYASTGSANISLRNMAARANVGDYAEDGIQAEVEGSAQINLLLENSELKNLAKDGLDVIVNTLSGTIFNLVVRNTLFTDNQGSGLSLAGAGVSDVRANLNVNTLTNQTGTAINLVSTGSSDLNAALAGNIITGVTGGNGVRLSQEEDSDMTVSLASSNVSGTLSEGLIALSRLSDVPAPNGIPGSLHLTATGNTIGAPVTGLTPAAFVAVQDTENQICLVANTNTLTGSGGAPALELGISETGVFQIAGLTPLGAGIPGSSAASYLSGRNTLTTPAYAWDNGGSAYTGVAAVGACRTTLPVVESTAWETGGRLRGLAAPLPVYRGSAAGTSTPAGLAGPDTLINRSIPLLLAGQKVVIVYEVDIPASLPPSFGQITSQASLTIHDPVDPVVIPSDDPTVEDPTGEEPPAETVIDLYFSPMANADTYTTPEDTPLVVGQGENILANDYSSSATKTLSQTSLPTKGNLDLHSDGTFSYTPGPDLNGDDSFSYRINDGFSDSALGWVTLHITPVNDAPVLNPLGSPSLGALLINQTDNPGNTVAEILASAGLDAVSDPDSGSIEGLALLDCDRTHGQWQYSLDSGVVWQDVPALSETNALLLSAEGARLRFIPDADWSGQITHAIRFRAWDRTSGTNGAIADVTTNGGQTAFSTAMETASVTVLLGVDVAITRVSAPAQAMSGLNLTYTVEVTNQSPTTAPHARLSIPLTGLEFISSTVACAPDGGILVCDLGDLGSGSVHELAITARLIPSVFGTYNKLFTLATDLPDLVPADNTANASTQVITGQKVYQQPATPGPEWSLPGQTTSPSGFSFLGEYGNETLTLSLDNLPEHTTVVVSFDLHILRSWDGNAEVVDLAGELSRFLDGRRGLGESVGPDIWQVEGGETLLLRTTFNNWPASNPGQAYPGAYPGDNHPAQSGAEGLNTLGYTFRDIPMDATYHIQLSLAGHTSTSLDLRFSAEGLQSLADESWGLSGVQVIVTGGGDLLPYRVYQPIIQR